jgi:hypothetical protein
MICTGSHGRTSLIEAIKKKLTQNETYDFRDHVYDALVSLQDNAGKRVTVIAKSYSDAREMLEREHGKGSVASLWNRALGNKPRSS